MISRNILGAKCFNVASVWNVHNGWFQSRPGVAPKARRLEYCAMTIHRLSVLDCHDY